MTTNILINDISGASPFNLYLCDPSNITCIYIDTISSSSLPYEFVVPVIMETQSSFNLKVVDNNGCIFYQNLTAIVVSSTPTPTPTLTPTLTPTNTVTPTNTPLPIMCFSYYALDYSGSTMFQCEVTADGTLYNGKKWWSLTGCPTNNVVWGGGPCPFSGYVWWDGFSGWRYTELLGGGSGLYYCYLNNPGDNPIQIIGLYEWVTTGMFTCVPTILNSYSGPCIPVTSTPTPTPTNTETPTPTPTPTNPCPICVTQDITIGTQIWAKCNLNVSTYNNGDPIPEVTDINIWTGLTTGAWCYYDDISSNGTIYGKLYNWYAVNDPRGIAPVGYHVPTDSDWTTLIGYLGGLSVAGGEMKESGLCHWANPNAYSYNTSNFTGLPGGFKANNGYSYAITTAGAWWSSTEINVSNSTYYFVVDFDTQVYTNPILKINGFSVRCIKD